MISEIYVEDLLLITKKEKLSNKEKYIKLTYLYIYI